jgi:hypothetical protein
MNFDFKIEILPLVIGANKPCLKSLHDGVEFSGENVKPLLIKDFYK